MQRADLSATDHPQFEKLQRAAGIEIRLKAARGSTLRLLLHADHLALMLPAGVSLDTGLQFLQRQILWVRKHLELREARTQKARLGLETTERAKSDTSAPEKSMPSASDFVLTEGARLPIFARSTALSFLSIGAPFQLLDAKLEILTSTRSDALSNSSGLSRQLRNALTAILQQALGHDVRKVAQFLGVQTRKITIKPMQSRWGSLGPNNTMNISFALLFAPRECLHYVVVHELCHVLERNHSSRFWAHVLRTMPTYRQWHDYLQSHHHELMSWQKRVLSHEPKA